MHMWVKTGLAIYVYFYAPLCCAVFGATESQVREVVCVKLLGMIKIKKGYGTHSFNLNLHTAQYKVSFTLNM